MPERPRSAETQAPLEHPLSVALLAGGRSSEHDVSLASGAAVREGLLEAGHEVRWVEIERDGSWRCEGGKPVSVQPGAGLLGADVAFPVLHGPFGEDGTIQGALEVLDVAYVGSGVAASALCIDKVLFKELMAARGAPQVDFVGVRRERFERAPQLLGGELARLGLPVFVKPAHLGSSVGIVRAGSERELDEALAAAFVHDELAIVEAMAPGVEIECAVLGVLSSERAAAGAAAVASPPGRITYSSEWYDYAAKYEPGGMQLHVPAGISAAATEAVRSLALETFIATGCHGLARVDFFVNGEQVLLNELNTMPGFTATSVYAKLIEAAGIAYPRLLDRLCRLALERHRERRSYRH